MDHNVEKNTKNSIAISKSSTSFLIFIILGLISIYLSTILYVNKSIYFENVYQIPLITGIFYLISGVFIQNIQRNIINLIVYLLYFVRNTLAIYLLYANSFQHKLYISQKSNIDRAITLMILETIIVFIALILIERGIIKTTSKAKESSRKINSQIYIPTIIWIIIIMGSLACFIAYILVPDIRLGYTLIFSSQNVNQLVDVVPTGFLQRVLYELFDFLFPIIQIVLPLCLIISIKKYIVGTNLAITLSLMLAASPLLILGTHTAYSLVVSIVLMFTIVEIYPRYRNRLFWLLGIFSLGLLVGFFIMKMGSAESDNSINNLSNFLQAYFPGLTNIAAAFNIPDSIVSYDILVNDFIRMIPFGNLLIPTSFYQSALDNRTVFLFTEAIRYPFQIMPSVSMAYLYIGYFAPLVNVGMIWFANRFYKNHQRNIFSFSIYSFIAIFFAISTVMYNYSNLGARFFDSLIWLIIIVKIFENVRLTKSKRRI